MRHAQVRMAGPGLTKGAAAVHSRCRPIWMWGLAMEGETFRLYTDAQLQPVFDAMARQCHGLIDHSRPLWLVGVLRRGAPLADRLREGLLRLAPALQIERLDLKVKRYGDDLTLLHPETRMDRPDVPADALSGQQVLVVDDVLYQGHSLFKVLGFLHDCAADPVRTAVLVDRCVTRLPIRADVVGLQLQISPTDVIECRVPPFEQELAIDLFRPQRG